MKKAADGRPVLAEEVNEMLEPFIQEANREKNTARLLLQLQSQDEYTFQHTINIGILAMVIGKWMKYSEQESARLALAGTLHDIGKSKIPLHILNKPGPLTRVEFEIMKKHTILGYELLNSWGYEENIKLAVLQHHEREDGKGYPYRLKGEKIHPFAKIVAVSDIYHAMTSKRVYKGKISPFLVLDHLQKNIDNLNSEIVLTFIEHMLQYLQSCKAVLNDGRIGDIVHVNRNNIGFPLVKISDSSTVIDLNKRRDIQIVDIVDS
ncbi:MAG: hypothetical protein JG781_408 [Peptococcaceae bacterium]|jgi:putative nucleotidyltransferase with HDIG domain|nr:hypothetical protein [Peptococcaceae bacterium]